ncbi:MAG: hypothetical protein M0Q43_01825 [Methanothrix sp.]|jgi:ElaB/YqjD/DUF883 family membrane-anchored ribosome-binding protein|nr:hypothetical protein [Methanothrix sp.]
MTNENIEKAKADTKKVVSDLENKLAHAKADVKAGAEKAKADVENKLAHAKADAEKAKADIGKKMNDALE